MKLFIADALFSEDIEVVAAPSPEGVGQAAGTIKIRRVEIRLPMTLTEPDQDIPPADPTLLDFVLDTGADYTSIFLDDLEEVGIPLEGSSGGEVNVSLLDGSEVSARTRNVGLWLYSNLPEQEAEPFGIVPDGGAVILGRRSGKRPELLRSLLGMNPLVDAGLRIEINAETKRYSVWVPD